MADEHAGLVPLVIEGVCALDEDVAGAHLREYLGRLDVQAFALSDDEVVSLLEKDDLHIARRTVAKYRKELDIPSSWRRREY